MILSGKKNKESSIKEAVKVSDKLEKTVTITQRDKNELIHFAHSTHIGTREYQQDSCDAGIGHNQMVYGVLCDGMGGLEGGELASRAAVETFVDAFNKMDPECDIPAFLSGLAIRANEVVFSLPADESQRGMSGTTLTGIIIKDGNLFWVSVGDSRIYIIRNGEIVSVTRDHSYSLDLEEQVRQGMISEQQAANDPQRDALISYLGMDELRLIDSNRNPFKLEEGDIILLCSDGLYKSLSDEDILGIIMRYGFSNIEECAHVLPLYAYDKKGGSQDNTTVVLFKYM